MMTENYELLVSKSIKSYCLKETILNSSEFKYKLKKWKEKSLDEENSSKGKYDRISIGGGE